MCAREQRPEPESSQPDPYAHAGDSPHSERIVDQVHMTFTEIQTEVLDRLGLSSTDDTTRIGRAINRVYRTVTSALGIKHVSRRTTVNATTSLGISTLTFSSSEKLINVVNRNVSPYKQLDEVTVDELRAEMPFSASDEPTRYAIQSITADTVTVLLNCVPQTAFALYADVYGSTATLSGSDEPAFSESYHDILIHGVLVDEYLKVEKPSLSALSEKRYDKRMGELQLWIAVSTTKQIHQGKTAQLVAPGGSAGGSGSSVNGALSYTQTGLVTFDRSAAGDVAPFAVAAAADAVVTNLDADKLDGQHGNYYTTAANLTGPLPAISGALLTNLPAPANIDAATITSGTLPDGRFPATLPAVSGANLTNLDASDLASGTVPDARFPATLPAVSGANLTNLDASDLASGTVPDARFPATLPAISGANLTNLDASDLASGTIPDGRFAAVGSWTPVLSAQTPGNLAVTYSAQVGRYFKIGPLVVVIFRIETSAFTHTTASGDALITGLPFTSLNVTNLTGAGAVGFQGITKAGFTQFTGEVQVNSTTMRIVAGASASGQSAVSIGQMPSGGSPLLMGSIAYFTAS